MYSSRSCMPVTSGAVTHNYVRKLTVEIRDHIFCSFDVGDVTLQAVHALDRSHLLQVDGNDLAFGAVLGGGALLVHQAAQHLAPRARRSTKVDSPPYALEEVELLIQLQQLERAAGAVADLLGLAVVDVTPVLAGLAHGYSLSM